MLCSFEPTDEVNAEGWRKHRCTRCGYVTVYIPPWSERIKKPCWHKGLGDRIADGLAFIGITKARVEEITGLPCKCQERQEYLNQFGKQLGL